MPFLQKLRNSSAQNITEYSMMIILVAAGIILAGPYIKRSINAGFQSVDDSVQDSFQDPLVEGEVPDIDCVCPDFSGSPPETCGRDECEWNSYLQKRNCSPIGCDTERQCIVDERCCSEGYYLPGCGANSDSRCGGTCSDSEQCVQFYCGENPVPQYECRPKRFCGICGINMALPSGHQYIGLCPDDDQDFEEILEYTIVPTGGCTEGRKCEVECNIPYLAKGGDPATFCGCQDCYTDGGVQPDGTGSCVPDSWDCNLSGWANDCRNCGSCSHVMQRMSWTGDNHGLWINSTSLRCRVPLDQATGMNTIDLYNRNNCWNVNLGRVPNYDWGVIGSWYWCGSQNGEQGIVVGYSETNNRARVWTFQMTCCGLNEPYSLESYIGDTGLTRGSTGGETDDCGANNVIIGIRGAVAGDYDDKGQYGDVQFRCYSVTSE